MLVDGGADGGGAGAAAGIGEVYVGGGSIPVRLYAEGCSHAPCTGRLRVEAVVARGDFQVDVDTLEEALAAISAVAGFTVPAALITLLRSLADGKPLVRFTVYPFIYIVNSSREAFTVEDARVELYSMGGEVLSLPVLGAPMQPVEETPCLLQPGDSFTVAPGWAVVLPEGSRITVDMRLGFHVDGAYRVDAYSARKVWRWQWPPLVDEAAGHASAIIRVGSAGGVSPRAAAIALAGLAGAAAIALGVYRARVASRPRG